MREQPPSDSEAHFAFAFSHMLPGPPPNLKKSKIKTTRSPGPTTANDFASAYSHCIRNTVTNDSIAQSAQPLIWGVFVWIRLALSVTAQPVWASSVRIVARNAKTAGCELHVQGRTKETPVNPIRVRCEIRTQFAERESSFDVGIFRGCMNWPHRNARSKSTDGGLTAPSALRKGMRSLAELPPMALSLGEHATTAFAGR